MGKVSSPLMGNHAQDRMSRRKLWDEHNSTTSAIGSATPNNRRRVSTRRRRGRQEEHREPLLIWGRTECGDRQPILPHLFNEYTYRQKEDAIDKEAIILVAQPFCGERSDDCKSTGYDIT
jgi:hypothetical protein